MQYAKIQNNKVIQIGSLEVLYPNTSFPITGVTDQWLQEHNLMKVIESEDYNESTQRLEYTNEPYIDNNIVRTYRIIELSQEDKNSIQQSKINNEWTLVREKRDNKLTDSDWTQMSDVTLSNKQDWLTYRQKLRDITTQSDPFMLDWPTKP